MKGWSPGFSRSGPPESGTPTARSNVEKARAQSSAMPVSGLLPVHNLNLNPILNPNPDLNLNLNPPFQFAISPIPPPNRLAPDESPCYISVCRPQFATLPQPAITGESPKMRHPGQDTRRSFVKSVATASVATTLAASLPAQDVHQLKTKVELPKEAGPNDRIRIATIGMGIIGFIDTETALKVPGIELVAAADLYEGRRTHAKEVFGSQVDTHVDYREILARKDVDAVLICVPDHWHARMSIDAMKAGKAVYCEKPMIRTVEEGPAVIAAQKETKAVFQVGSQYASSILYDKVKDLIREGVARQGARDRGAVQPQFRYRRLAILDPDGCLARNDRLGSLPRRRAQAGI